MFDAADLDCGRQRELARLSASGQICMSAGRMLVHSKIAADFSRRLADKARSLPVGNPTTGQVALGRSSLNGNG